MQLPIQIPISIGPAAIGTATVLLVIIVFAFLSRGGRRKADIYALIIDETDGTISLQKFLKIEDRVYTAIDTTYPMFLILPSGTKTFQCYAGKTKVPCVLAYARGLLALPLDPNITAALSHLLSTEDLVSLQNEETVKLLRTLYEMEEKKLGKIRISTPTVVAVAFDVKRIISEIINKIFGAASEAVIHYFRSARNIEALEKYLQALGTYAERRMSWLWYIAMIIIAIAIAFVLIAQVVPGLFPMR